MLKYHAAYYQDGDWYAVTLLDFPGVNSQGRTLKQARYMIKDALKLMAECYVDQGRALPKPKRKIRDRIAVFQEKIGLEFHARSLVEK